MKLNMRRSTGSLIPLKTDDSSVNGHPTAQPQAPSSLQANKAKISTKMITTALDKTESIGDNKENDENYGEEVFSEFTLEKKLSITAP